MTIVGAFDVHRAQITFDYLDGETGEVRTGRIVPADREQLRAWLERFEDRDDVAFAVEGCTGWRYVVDEEDAALDMAQLGLMDFIPIESAIGAAAGPA